MDWLSGSKQGQAKKLITQLADPAKRDQAVHELIGMGKDAVLPLIDALQTQDLSLLPYYQQILARIPSATPALTKALSTAHPIIRARVAEIFSISKDRNAIPALIDAIKGEYFTVRSRAALALGNIGDAHVTTDLLPLLKDGDGEVRIAACIALGKFRDPSTFDEIANILLDDPKIEARQAAALALGDTKHPATIPFLMDALRDSFWWFEREQAASDLLIAIEKIGPAVVEPLIEALGDKEATVRRFAAIILGSLGDIHALEELGMAVYDLHHGVSEAAAEALAKLGAPAVSILSEALLHPELGIRENAVNALGKIQDIRVAPVLIEMLNDPERVVQKQAMRSLAQLRDQRVLPALQEIAANRADRELSALAKQIIEGIK